MSCIVDDEHLLEHARSLARTLAQKPPATLRFGRAAFRNEIDREYRARVAAAVENFCVAAAGEEAREGIAAFIEKRPPAWRE